MNLADFHFIRPYWFFALLPLVLFFVLSLKYKLSRGNWAEVCDDALLPFILQDSHSTQSRWPRLVISLASLLVIFSLAGPTWQRLPSPVFRNDAALVIALDLSRSMEAADIKPSRLIRARYKIADILKQRKDGLTALLVYAGDAFIVTPLTEDTNTISSQLTALETDIMPSQGSNTQAAIQQAVKLLQQAGQQQGSILLVSDGVNDSVIKQAVKLLGPYQLSVLGVGTLEGAPVKLAAGDFLKDAKGNIVVPKLNEQQLAELADVGNGIYQTISLDNSDVNAVMTRLDKATTQPSTEKSDRLIEQWAEQGPWLLLLVLPLVALYFRKGLLVVPVIIILNFPQDSYAFDWQDLWQTQDQQAQQAFNQQQFEQAEQQFQSPEWKAAAQYKSGNYQQSVETLESIDSADSYYNQGNALAKMNQLKPAIEAYQQALEIDPNHQDAQYNKDLLEQAMEQQQSESNNEQQEQGEKSDQQKDDQNSDSNQSEDKQQSSQSEQKQEEQQQEEQQSDSEQQDKEQEQAEQQNKDQQDNEEKQDAEQQSAEQQKEDENEQANAQWLQRIPDDPAGLLKRKFKYQYKQRKNTQQQEQLW